MSVVKKNLAIAVIARAISSLSSFIMLPLYLPLMGKDAFGLIALGVATVQLLFVLSSAMRPVIAREISVRLKEKKAEYPVIRINECLAVIILCIILLVYPYLAKIAIGGADLGKLSESVALECFSYLFIAIGFGSFTSIYLGVINGRQKGFIKAILNNGKQICIAVGGYLALVFTKGDPTSYFKNLLWIELIFALVAALFVWLPIKEQFTSLYITKDDFHSLAKLGSFNIVIGGVAALFAFSEKWMLGQCLSMASVGYFSLLMVPFIVISNLAGAVGTVAMPRLAELQVAGGEEKKKQLLRKATWFTNASLVTLIAIIACNPPLFYGVWLKDAELVSKITPFVGLAIIIQFPLSHTNLLYNYDLAAARLSSQFFVNTLKLVLVLTAGFFLLKNYGLREYLILLCIMSSLAVFGVDLIRRMREQKSFFQIIQSFSWYAGTILSPMLFLVLGIGGIGIYFTQLSSHLNIESFLWLLLAVALSGFFLLLHKPVREILIELSKILLQAFKKRTAEG